MAEKEEKKKEEKKGIAEKTGETTGKIGRGAVDGTKSLFGGMKKGFKKKDKEE